MICSFFGHSKIHLTQELIDALNENLEELITKKDYNIFYFGGFGDFDFLCWELVTKLKEKYPNIVRIYCLENQKMIYKKPWHINKDNYDDFIYLTPTFDY